MGKRINLKKIAPTQTYKISELAKLLRITPSAIYLKIKDNLPVVPNGKNYYINGEDFIIYEKARRSKRKKGTLAPGEMYCLSCQKKQVPIDRIARIKNSKKTPFGTLRLVGICPICNKEMQYITNINKLPELENYFNIE